MAVLLDVADDVLVRVLSVVAELIVETVLALVLVVLQVRHSVWQLAATLAARLGDSAVSGLHCLSSRTWQDSGSTCPLQIGADVLVEEERVEMVVVDVLVVLVVHVLHITGHNFRTFWLIGLSNSKHSGWREGLQFNPSTLPLHVSVCVELEDDVIVLVDVEADVDELVVVLSDVLDVVADDVDDMLETDVVDEVAVDELLLELVPVLELVDVDPVELELVRVDVNVLVDELVVDIVAVDEDVVVVLVHWLQSTGHDAIKNAAISTLAAVSVQHCAAGTPLQTAGSLVP